MHAFSTIYYSLDQLEMSWSSCIRNGSTQLTDFMVRDFAHVSKRCVNNHCSEYSDFDGKISWEIDFYIVGDSSGASQHPTWTEKRGIERRWGREGGEGWLAGCTAFLLLCFHHLHYLCFWSALKHSLLKSSILRTLPSFWFSLFHSSVSLSLPLGKEIQQSLLILCSMLI